MNLESIKLMVAVGGWAAAGQYALVEASVETSTEVSAQIGHREAAGAADRAPAGRIATRPRCSSRVEAVVLAYESGCVRPGHTGALEL